MGQVVFGVQADYAWADADGRSPNLIQTAQGLHTHIKSLVSVTGRVGYAWERLLGYVKGGGAWERDNYDFYVPATGATISTASDQRRGGWTVGIGGEYVFTNQAVLFHLGHYCVLIHVSGNYGQVPMSAARSLAKGVIGRIDAGSP